MSLPPFFSHLGKALTVGTPIYPRYTEQSFRSKVPSNSDN
jgi:hypothetical protein